MRTVLRFASLAAAAALAAAGPADAATRRITLKPNSLAPVVTHQVDSHNGILNGGTGVLNYARLRIPVGAKITGLSYRHWSVAPNKTSVSVDRVQPGKTPSWQRIYSGLSEELCTVGSTGIMVNGTLVPGATRKVQAGWDYFVLTHTNASVAIGEIVVKYETP